MSPVLDQDCEGDARLAGRGVACEPGVVDALVGQGRIVFAHSPAPVYLRRAGLAGHLDAV